jgi:hypothetical protein
VTRGAPAGFESDASGIDYRRLGAGAPPALPATQSIWRAHATGTGTQTITWPVEKGHWSAVAMNADGSRNVSVDAQLAAACRTCGGSSLGCSSSAGCRLPAAARSSTPAPAGAGDHKGMKMHRLRFPQRGPDWPLCVL